MGMTNNVYKHTLTFKVSIGETTDSVLKYAYTNRRILSSKVLSDLERIVINYAKADKAILVNDIVTLEENP